MCLCCFFFIQVYRDHANPLLVVAGDVNDSMGTDFFEEHYVLTDSIDALLGSPFYHTKMLR